MIFVTGGAGLIGRHLIKKLLIEGHKVTCFDLSEQIQRSKNYFASLDYNQNLRFESGTILDKSHLSISMSGVTTVFHLAAMLGVKRTEDSKLRCIEVNVDGSRNVLEACVKNNVKHIIFASSSEVYGEPIENPIKEDAITQGKTVYAVTKLAGEELVKGYAQIYKDLNFTIARFFNTYGEGQVAQFVLSRFINNAMNNKEPIIYGDGNQIRSFGHVDDVTNGLILIIKNKISHGKVYNLGNSNEVFSLTELAKKVIHLVAVDKNMKPKYISNFNNTDRLQEREIYTRYCDTSLAKNDLNFEAKVTIDEGIRRIVESGKIDSDWDFHP